MGWKLSLAPEPPEQQPPWTFDCCKDTHTKGKQDKKSRSDFAGKTRVMKTLVPSLVF